MADVHDWHEERITSLENRVNALEVVCATHTQLLTSIKHDTKDLIDFTKGAKVVLRIVKWTPGIAATVGVVVATMKYFGV